MMQRFGRRFDRIRSQDTGLLGVLGQLFGGAADFGEWRASWRLFGGLPPTVLVRCYRALNEVGFAAELSAQQRRAFFAAIDDLFAGVTHIHGDDVRGELEALRKQREDERSRRHL